MKLFYWSWEELFTALLRCNWHTINSTYLKYANWWILTYVYHETISTIKIMNLFIIPKSFLMVLRNPPSNEITTDLIILVCISWNFIYFYIHFIYNVYKWNYTVSTLWGGGLASFTQHNHFEAHSCCVGQWFIPFHCWVSRVCPYHNLFIHSPVDGLFPVWDFCKESHCDHSCTSVNICFHFL